MTNAKVHSGLRDDKKLKSTVLNSTRVEFKRKQSIYEKETQSSSEQ